MAPALIPADMAVSKKFVAFNIVDIQYKVVNGTSIPASVLVPKTLKPGKYPVLVRWHGGCLITGHRMYPEWFGNWILELAVSRDAIVISPDYRLMPEANGLDILQDVRDFYQWLTTPGNLVSHLPEGICADVENLLVTGESAGGWLALQSALLSSQYISAVISMYPMIDMRDGHYTGDYEKQLFTPRVPQLDRSILEDYVATMKPGEVITSAVPPDRVPLVISFLQQGAYSKFFGNESILYPLEVLASENVKELPPTWIVHGTGDTVIPVEGSYKYEKQLKEKLPDAKLHVHYDQGSDHGFDNAVTISLETKWVKTGLNFISAHWPHS